VRVIYAPDGGESRSWAFNPGDLEFDEAALIEAADPGAWATFDEFGQAFMADSLRAVRAALWILLRRDHPGLDIGQVRPRPREVAVVFDEAELAVIRAAITDDPDIDPRQRERLLGEAGGVDGPKPTGGDSPPAADGTPEASPAGEMSTAAT
jgi:hypothetical protein